MFFPKFCHPNVEDNSIESHAESKSLITSHLCKHSEKCEICKVTKKHISLSQNEFYLMYIIKSDFRVNTILTAVELESIIE